jgi:hypothetical protein
MASASDIIPIIGAVAPSVIQLLQKLFTKDQAADKKSIATDVLSVLAQLLAGKGKAPPTSTDDISALVEAVLAALKITPGGLPPPADGGTAAVVLPGATAYVLNGTLTAVK